MKFGLLFYLLELPKTQNLHFLGLAGLLFKMTPKRLYITTSYNIEQTQIAFWAEIEKHPDSHKVNLGFW